MKFPRIMLAGTNSGVGKTTVSLGLMKALSKSGHTVHPFKVGPDYIDPGLHYLAAGRRSHNLDSWMGSAATVLDIFCRNSSEQGIALIEGVMGLFDGARGQGIKGSSAEIALMLKTPVILLLNARGMAQSCVPAIKGYLDYCPGLDIRGVVLNHSSDFHRNWIKRSIEDELGVKVLGCIPRVGGIIMPERHLGLLPAEENQEIIDIIDKMAALIESELDLKAIGEIARGAEKLEVVSSIPGKSFNVSVGVARDEAFTFYYQDSLDYLEELGAKLHFFSPLHDSSLPAVDGLYMGGGFPEMFLDDLVNNLSMSAAIRCAHQQSMPIFAECGAYMYLSASISDWQGKRWEGVGTIPLDIEMTSQLQDLGYAEATAWQDSLVAAKGDVLRGHVFHYSRARGICSGKEAFILHGGIKQNERMEGYAANNLLASYLHLHLRSNPQAAGNFLKACQQYKASKSYCHAY